MSICNYILIRAELNNCLLIY